jgi:hypothetical protein
MPLRRVAARVALCCVAVGSGNVGRCRSCFETQVLERAQNHLSVTPLSPRCQAFHVAGFCSRWTTQEERSSIVQCDLTGPHVSGSRLLPANPLYSQRRPKFTVSFFVGFMSSSVKAEK